MYTCVYIHIIIYIYIYIYKWKYIWIHQIPHMHIHNIMLIRLGWVWGLGVGEGSIYCFLQTLQMTKLSLSLYIYVHMHILYYTRFAFKIAQVASTRFGVMVVKGQGHKPKLHNPCRSECNLVVLAALVCCACLLACSLARLLRQYALMEWHLYMCYLSSYTLMLLRNARVHLWTLFVFVDHCFVWSNSAATVTLSCRNSNLATQILLVPQQ